MIDMWPSFRLALSIALIAVALIAITLFLDVRITESNASKYAAIGTILAAIMAVLALFVVAYQTMQLRTSVNLQGDQIRLQAATFELEHRPYLYLYLPSDQLKVWLNQAEGGWFGGGDLRFRNVGKDPASITQADYMVASDVRGEIPLRKWFEEEFGGFPDISSVFPGQEDARVPCHPNISPVERKPQFLYIGAVVSYVGPKKDRRYWYKFSQTYVLEFLKEVDKQPSLVQGPLYKVVVHPLKPDHEWDKNPESEPPKLMLPNWADYLSQSYIKKLTQEKGTLTIRK